MTTPRAHILFVDDDPVFRETTSKVLRDAGFEVNSAEDFRLALELLEKPQPVDLLVTDIVMPQRVNGLALARMARMRRPGLKILYLTGYDLPGAEREALGTVLHKPIDNDALIAAVERAIAG
jgi:CheY-like chemotaxis protein